MCFSCPLHFLPNQSLHTLAISLHCLRHIWVHIQLYPLGISTHALLLSNVHVWAQPCTNSKCSLQSIYPIWCWLDTSRIRSFVCTSWDPPNLKKSHSTASDSSPLVWPWTYSPSSWISSGSLLCIFLEWGKSHLISTTLLIPRSNESFLYPSFQILLQAPSCTHLWASRPL